MCFLVLIFPRITIYDCLILGGTQISNENFKHGLDKIAYLCFRLVRLFMCFLVLIFPRITIYDCLILGGTQISNENFKHGLDGPLTDRLDRCGFYSYSLFSSKLN